MATEGQSWIPWIGLARNGSPIADVQFEYKQSDQMRIEEEEEPELVPGEKVPQTGKYRCTSCGKSRLGGRAVDLDKRDAVPRITVKHLKQGKTFPECTNCEELTEWEFLGE
jgi:hypothetical protein